MMSMQLTTVERHAAGARHATVAKLFGRANVDQLNRLRANQLI